MKKWVAALVFLAAGGFGVDAWEADWESKVEALHENEDYRGAIAYLESGLGQISGRPKAMALTLLARETCAWGTVRRSQGAKAEELLPIFEKGEAYASQALAHDKGLFQTYYWRSANVGRWGQVKGVLDSLFKAESMKNDLIAAIRLNPVHPESYNVLGLLHAALPGFPISFGNKDYAVSLARKAVDLVKEEWRTGQRKKPNSEMLVELARHLWARNWDAEGRVREQAQKRSQMNQATGTFEKSCFYEGSVTLPSLSDRQEARSLIAGLVTELRALPSPSPEQMASLANYQKLLEQW